jgi:intein/homing endonuclease
MTRGIKHDVDRFISELSAKYLPWKVYKDGTANIKAGDYVTQVQVRPIQLWEIVFPEESKDLVLNTLFKQGDTHETQHKKHRKFIFALRKILGVEPLPEQKDRDFSKGVIPLYQGAVELIGVGIKSDYRFKDGTEGL